MREVKARARRVLGGGGSGRRNGSRGRAHLRGAYRLRLRHEERDSGALAQGRGDIRRIGRGQPHRKPLRRRNGRSAVRYGGGGGKGFGVSAY